jgi:3-dehydroshikimate dehydratase
MQKGIEKLANRFSSMVPKRPPAGHKRLAVSPLASYHLSDPGLDFRCQAAAGNHAMIRLSAFADEISQDPAAQLDVLTEHGIKFIEFRAIHGTNVLDLSESQHADYREKLDARGFGLSAIGSPIGKVLITEPFNEHLERFDLAMQLADFYATPRIRIFSFYMPPGDDPGSHRDAVLRQMAELTRRAAGRGITLILENEKGIYGDTANRVADILESVASPFLIHAFDPANYLEVGQSIDLAWTRLRAHVKHFHVKDYDTTTHRNVPAGAGDGQIPRLIADAASNGYEGFCVLEPHLVVAEKSFGFTGPERFADAANALKKILREASIAFA